MPCAIVVSLEAQIERPRILGLRSSIQLADSSSLTAVQAVIDSRGSQRCLHRKLCPNQVEHGSEKPWSRAFVWCYAPYQGPLRWFRTSKVRRLLALVLSGAHHQSNGVAPFIPERSSALRPGVRRSRQRRPFSLLFFLQKKENLRKSG